MDFSRWWPKHFSRKSSSIVFYHFSTKKLIEKYQKSKNTGGPALFTFLSDAHVGQVTPKTSILELWNLRLVQPHARR